MNDIVVIGVCGKIGHGKDTLSDYLVENYGFEKLSLAKPIKQAVSALYNIPMQTMEDRVLKETIDPRWNKSPRQILQWLGTEVLRNNDKDHLTKLCKYKINHIINDTTTTTKRIVISDVRFDNEAQMIREFQHYYNITNDFTIKTEIIKVDATTRLLKNNETINETSSTRKHASESGISPELIGITVYNNKDQVHFLNTIDEIITEIV